MAGYNFDFAFPLWRVQLGNAEMFPSLSQLEHTLGTFEQ